MKATIINLYTGKSEILEATKETKNTIVFVVEGQEIKFSKKTQQGTIVDKFVYDEIIEEIVYDVCNDYSLDISSDKPDMSLYKTTSHSMGQVLVHNDYNEIHYLVSNNPNMNGKYLF